MQAVGKHTTKVDVGAMKGYIDLAGHFEKSTMKHIYYILIFLLIFTKDVNCQDIETIVGSKTIENYQKFLIENPCSPLIISITDSLRQMWDRQNIENYHCYCNSNCIEILVNSKNEIRFENKDINISNLKESLIYAIENPNNKQNLPEKEIIKSKFFGDIVRSKGIVDIMTSDVTPEFYSEIIVVVESAFIEIRVKWAKYFFAKDNIILDKQSKEELNKLLPFRIRFERYIPGNLRLPYPPAQKYKLEGFPDIEKNEE